MQQHINQSRCARGSQVGRGRHQQTFMNQLCVICQWVQKKSRMLNILGGKTPSSWWNGFLPRQKIIHLNRNLVFKGIKLPVLFCLGFFFFFLVCFVTLCKVISFRSDISHFHLAQLSEIPHVLGVHTLYWVASVINKCIRLPSALICRAAASLHSSLIYF